MPPIKILVVEDQAEIRHLIRVTLACGDYEVYDRGWSDRGGPSSGVDA